MNVEVVRWPADSMRLAELREASVPRLLVVADDAEPPQVPDEDHLGPDSGDAGGTVRGAPAPPPSPRKQNTLTSRGRESER